MNVHLQESGLNSMTKVVKMSNEKMEGCPSLLSLPVSSTDDERRARILEGATKVFLSYGFNRTTMDDIARAAEMSRPALYLFFRNKAEIYRALARAHLEQSVASAHAILARPGPLADRLRAVVEECAIAIAEALAASPHGAELIDMKSSIAADLVADWRERMTQLLGEAISRDAAARGIDLAARGLSAETVAAAFWDGMEGMKLRLDDWTARRQAAEQHVNLLCAALGLP
jgi:AcrR family transcriptional regulator